MPCTLVWLNLLEHQQQTQHQFWGLHMFSDSESPFSCSGEAVDLPKLTSTSSVNESIPPVFQMSCHWNLASLFHQGNTKAQFLSKERFANHWRRLLVHVFLGFGLIAPRMPQSKCKSQPMTFYTLRVEERLGAPRWTTDNFPLQSILSPRSMPTAHLHLSYRRDRSPFSLVRQAEMPFPRRDVHSIQARWWSMKIKRCLLVTARWAK